MWRFHILLEIRIGSGIILDSGVFPFFFLFFNFSLSILFFSLSRFLLRSLSYCISQLSYLLRLCLCLSALHYHLISPPTTSSNKKALLQLQMGLYYRTYLEGPSTVYGCSDCGTHLATSESIISRVSIDPHYFLVMQFEINSKLNSHPCSNFKVNMVKPFYSKKCNYRKQAHVVQGHAHILYQCRVNISFGKAEDRDMTTGLHRVRDISCVQCSKMLGWTYVGSNKLMWDWLQRHDRD